MAETATASTIYVWDGETGRDGTIFVSYKKALKGSSHNPTLREGAELPHPTSFSSPPQSFIISNINISDSHVLSWFSLSILFCKFQCPSLLDVLPITPIPSPLSLCLSLTLDAFFSRYWPRPPVPVPGGCPGGWASHSRGCSVHSSHRLPWGLPRSAAAGCLPGMKGRGGGKRRRQWKPQHISHCWILNGEAFFSPHLLTCNVFI